MAWAPRGLAPQRMNLLVSAAANSPPGMRRQDQADGVILHRRRDQHLAHQLLPLLDLVAVHDLLRRRPFAARGAVEDGRHLLAAGVVDDQLEEEAVELGFRQRIGAFLLDRVLRRHHEERLFQLVDGAADGDAVFLHGFQQGRLRFRRGPVDFVGQHDLGEERAGSGS